MESKDIYQLARNLEPAEAAILTVNAKTDEERKFWIYVHDMNHLRQLKQATNKKKKADNE